MIAFTVVLFLFSSTGFLVAHAAASPLVGPQPPLAGPPPAPPPTPHPPPTHPGKHATQQLLLAIQAVVANAGNQHYIIQAGGPPRPRGLGGQPYTVSLLGTLLSFSSTKPMNFNYHLDATINGLAVSGNANFQLAGALSNGSNINLDGNAQIVDAVPAVCLPSYMIGACMSSDTSEVPAFFIGSANIQYTLTTPPTPDQAPTPTSPPTPPTSPENVNMNDVQIMFESAYMNPFGNPITIASMDGYTLLIVTPYTQATIDWSNVVDAGTIAGTLGNTSVTGTFSQVAQEHEDLVSGIAKDHGSITFSGMTAASLDATSNYNGVSFIPTSPSFDCSAWLTGVPNTCASTGFQSSGNFSMHTNGPNRILINGTYSSIWSTPAFFSESTVTAAIPTQ
jgi:hypothetical protein